MSLVHVGNPRRFGGGGAPGTRRARQKAGWGGRQPGDVL